MNDYAKVVADTFNANQRIGREIAEDRVTAFLDRRDENNKQYGPESYNHMIDTIDTFNTGEYLSYSDIREILRELDAWRERAHDMEQRVVDAAQILANAGSIALLSEAWQRAMEALQGEGDAPQGDPITSTTD